SIMQSYGFTRIAPTPRRQDARIQTGSFFARGRPPLPRGLCQYRGRSASGWSGGQDAARARGADPLEWEERLANIISDAILPHLWSQNWKSCRGAVPMFWLYKSIRAPAGRTI